MGLDNHGFRYYDNEIGRYITRDPIGYGDGLNVYVYTGNNPVSRIDPWGMDYVTVSEGNAYWVVQTDWWGPVDKDMRWVMLGAVSDGMVTLGGSFGGGSVKLNHLMFAAKAFWGREGTSLMNPVDISGFGDEMQDQLIRWHLDRELNPTGQLRWEAPRASLRTKTQKNLDAIQGWADYGGAIPVVGMAFDIPNTITYGLRGRKTEFAMGAVGIIPFYGDAIQYGKILRKAAKNVPTQLHHNVPKFLGGDVDQVLTPLGRDVHGEFHSLLRANLKDAGIPLNVGGKGGSAADWTRYFNANPGAQRTALDAVLDTSRAIDYQRGTRITRDVWQNVIEGNFTTLP